MKLTTKGRFAVTAMVDLALHEEEAPISLTQISERQQISVAYLEQIFCKLRRAGLVAAPPASRTICGRTSTGPRENFWRA